MLLFCDFLLLLLNSKRTNLTNHTKNKRIQYLLFYFYPFEIYRYFYPRLLYTIISFLAIIYLIICVVVVDGGCRQCCYYYDYCECSCFCCCFIHLLAGFLLRLLLQLLTLHNFHPRRVSQRITQSRRRWWPMPEESVVHYTIFERGWRIDTRPGVVHKFTVAFTIACTVTYTFDNTVVSVWWRKRQEDLLVMIDLIYLWFETVQQFNFTQLHSTPLHSTPLHSTPLHSTPHNSFLHTSEGDDVGCGSNNWSVTRWQRQRRQYWQHSSSSFRCTPYW